MLRRTTVKWLVLFLIGCFLPFYALAACTSQQAGTASSTNSASPVAASQPLIVGTSPWAGFVGQYAAEAKGLFSEEGVTVNEVAFNTTGDVNTALAAGKIDLGWIGANDLVTLSAKAPDLKLKLIMMSDYSNGADGVLGRGITKPEDLKGKRVAREDGLYHVVLLATYLSTANLTEKDMDVVVMPAADAAVAFASGKIDLATTYEPYLAKAAREGKGEILFSTKDSNILPDGVAVRDEVLQARKPEILAYLRAVGKAVDFAEKNPKEAAEIIGKKIGVAPEEIPPQLAGIRLMNVEKNKSEAFVVGSSLSAADSLKRAAKIAHELGITPTLVDGGALVDDSIVKEL